MVGIQVSQVVRVNTNEEKNELLNRLFSNKNKSSINTIQQNLSKTPQIRVQRSTHIGR
ncbi:MAG: hypothetical protein ABS913_01470 [Desemzia incerta]|uniref:hypothetical protein n=1 Tax=Desemzia incerta TaxID=82801 RepID=UPI003315F452